jgi:transcription termination factor Rho
MSDQYQGRSQGGGGPPGGGHSGGGHPGGGGNFQGGGGGRRRRRRGRRGGRGPGGGGPPGGGGGGGYPGQGGGGGYPQPAPTFQGGRPGGGRQGGGGGRRRGGRGRPGRGFGGGRRGGEGMGGPQQWYQKQPEYQPGGEVPATCDGVAEVMADGYAFLRKLSGNMLAAHDDVWIPAPLVRQYNIQTGSRVVGTVVAPQRPGQRPSVGQIESIDEAHPDQYKLRVPFKHLTTIDPDRWMRLEGDGKEMTTRVIDLLAPIGFGQRYLIVAPPRTGKTVVLQKLGDALNKHYPETHVMVLLINERPEEVTDIRRTIKGDVIASSLDDLAPSHVAVAEMTFARAQRMVEQGRHVVLLVDSLTRMARAYNMEIGSSQRTLSGGLDSRAMEHPKRHFGSARNVEGGGSLTVIATALVDTGSRMDQVIFEEFKGTGNAELVLSRALADLRIFPAMDISKSGTRKEEKIIPADILQQTWTLRRVLNKLKPVEAMELLVDKLQATKNNKVFLEHFKIQ